MAADDALTSAYDRIDRLIASWEAPAFLVDRYLTVIVANDLARALSPAFRPGSNLAQFTFREPTIDRSTPLFDAAARQVVALLHDSLDKHAGDTSIQSIVTDLSVWSAEFAAVWTENSLTASGWGAATFQATPVGDITLAYVLLGTPAHRDHTLFVWVPEDPRSVIALEELSALNQANKPS
jgi:hypothetical protein